MRRFAVLFPLLLGVAACAPDAGTRRPPSLDWRTQVNGGDLLVSLADRRGYYRVERVSLVAPSGKAYPAFELTREVVRDDRSHPLGPGVGVGGGFGSGGWSGVGVGVSVPLGEPGRPERGAWTRARIPLPPEPRPLGPDWKIVVEVSDPSGALRFAELPAPAGD